MKAYGVIALESPELELIVKQATRTPQEFNVKIHTILPITDGTNFSVEIKYEIIQAQKDKPKIEVVK